MSLLQYQKPDELALFQFMRTVRRNRELIWEMTKRDLFERYAGEALGGLWAIVQPLLIMTVYTFVFTYIFNLRIGGKNGGLNYVAFLLAALVPWLAIQDAIGRAPMVIIESRNLVKQIVFPAEILPLKMVLSTVVMLLVGIAFPTGMLALQGRATLFWVLLPLPIACHLLLVLGLTYVLSATTVFVRDIKNIVQLLLMIGLFVHPILYTPGMLPHWAEIAFHLSPLSYVLWMYRDVIVFGQVTRPLVWVAAPIISIGIFAFGYSLFLKLRHGLGDAL